MEELINKIVPMIPQSKKDLTNVVQSVKRELPKYWDSKYIIEVLNKMPGGTHKLLMQFLWMSGVRITEALSVRKRDLDLQRYVVTVRWLKSRKYLKRVIPLHPKLKDILEVYTANMNMDDRLFPFSRQRAWQIVKKWFNGHPHQFRHSFAVYWLRNHGDIITLSKALGHSRIQNTMIYLNIVPLDVGRELLKLSFD